MNIQTKGPINAKAVIGYVHREKSFKEALALAEKLFKKDKRKYTRIAYFSHPTTVASLLLETAVQPAQMVAAALEEMLVFNKLALTTIANKFGGPVAAMVTALTPVMGANAVDYKAYGENLQNAGYPVQTIKVASLLDHLCSVPKGKLAEAFKLVEEVEALLPYLGGANAELLRRLQAVLRNARA